MIKVKTDIKLTRIGLHVAFGVILLMGFAGASATAASSKSSTSKSSSSTSASSSAGSNQPNQTSGGSLQGYASDSVLQSGTVVQLSSGSANKVEPAIYKDAQQMYGVTVDPHLLQVTITDSTLPNEVFVATGGTYNVLVDTQNGAIKSGDYVTISSLNGVAMKAGTYVQQKMVLGRAVGSFDGKNNIIGSTSLKNTNGSSAGTVRVGIIPVAIGVQVNPNDRSTKTNLPPLLQKVGQAIAQKPVSTIRIYLSIVITGMSIIVAMVTLYSGIRSAIIAIGRNPLSKKSIFRGLLEIILTGFLILIIGLFAVYLLLRL